MNHLEMLTAEWLAFNGYFVRPGVKVGRRPKGGWDGELDVVGFNPERRHFLHVECSSDGYSWAKREKNFRRKFSLGRKHAHSLFAAMDLPTKLDQVVVHLFATAPDRHRRLGGGRLMTSQELTAEIIFGLPSSAWTSAVPENYPLLRTLQIAKMTGVEIEAPKVRLIPSEGEL